MDTKENNLTVSYLPEERFEAEVIQSPQPALVVFETPWSQPCQILDPVLQTLGHDCRGKVKVIKVNADDALNLSLCYDVHSIPTLMCFVGGKLRFQIVGTASKDAILAKLKALSLADGADNFASGAGAATPKGGLV